VRSLLAKMPVRPSALTGGLEPQAVLRAAEGWLRYPHLPKAPLGHEPASGSRSYQVKHTWGHESEHLLFDRPVRILFDKGRHYFACRQVTRFDPASAHQA